MSTAINENLLAPDNKHYSYTYINKIETIDTSDRTVPAHTKTKCNDCNSSALPSSFKEILYTNTSYSRENNNGLIATTAYHPYRALNLHECIASVMTMTA